MQLFGCGVTAFSVLLNGVGFRSSIVVVLHIYGQGSDWEHSCLQIGISYCTKAYSRVDPEDRVDL